VAACLHCAADRTHTAVVVSIHDKNLCAILVGGAA
jgi:hypothetical protein